MKQLFKKVSLLFACSLMLLNFLGCATQKDEPMTEDSMEMHSEDEMMEDDSMDSSDEMMEEDSMEPKDEM